MKEKLDKNKLIQNARKYALKGQYDKAIQEWQKVADETPGEGTIYNTIGDLYLKMNNSFEAVNAFKKAAEIFKDAGFVLKTIAVYKKVLKIDNTLVEIQLKLGDLNSERDLKSNAIENYLEAAKFYSKQGNMKESISAYRKMINVDPNNNAMRLKFADICLKEGLAHDATEEYLKVASIYAENHLFDKAEEIYDKILSYDKDNEEVQGLLKDTVSKCVTSFGSPQKEKNKEDAIRAKAEHYIAEGNIQKAEALLEDLVRNNPGKLDYKYTLGQFYLSSGKIKSAFTEFMAVIEDYMLNEKFQEVIEISSKVVSADPNNTEAREIKAKALLMNLRINEAYEEYRFLINIYIGKNNIPECRALFKNINKMPEHLLVKLEAMIPAEEIVEEKEIDDFDISFDTGPEDNANNAGDADPMAADNPSAECEDVSMESRLEHTAFDTPANNDNQTGLRQDIPNYFTEAEVYFKYGLNTKVVELLNMILAIEPDNIEALTKLKEAYKLDGKVDKAVYCILRLTKIYTKTDIQGSNDIKNALDAELSEIDPDGIYSEAVWEEENMSKIHFDTISDNIAIEKDGELENIANFDDKIVDISSRREKREEDPAKAPAEGGWSVRVDQGKKADVQQMIEEADFYFKQGLVEEAHAIYKQVLKIQPDNERANKLLNQIKLHNSENTEDLIFDAAKPEEENDSFYVIEDEDISNIPSFTDKPAGSSDIAYDDLIFQNLNGELEEISEETDEHIIVLEEETENQECGISIESDTQLDEDENGLINKAAKYFEEIDKTASENIVQPEKFGINQKINESTNISSSDLKAANDEDSDFYDLSSFLDEDPAAESTKTQDASLDNSFTEVFKEFQAGVQKQFSSEDHETHYNLGVAYKEMGLLNEALNEFILSAKGEDNYLSSMTLMAECYKESGNKNKAIEVLEELAKYLQNDKSRLVWIKYDLAELFEEKNEIKKAYNLYKEVYDCDINIKEVAKRVALLKKRIGEDLELENDKSGAGIRQNRISYL